ncbi:hypothetical protein HGA92_02315 [Candidatus Gracilibacteria bacterium]|nr:hypothetical protein [Candidatus Gracilibacteria bacterium]NUJ99391.1 hypothetical protein [Candidatus Gracilibacteria bacterium]
MSHRKHKNKKGYHERLFGPKNGVSLNISTRTALYMLVVIVAFLTFIMKMEELKSQEVVKMQLTLLELRQDGYF